MNSSVHVNKKKERKLVLKSAHAASSSAITLVAQTFKKRTATRFQAHNKTKTLEGHSCDLFNATSSQTRTLYKNIDLYKNRSDTFERMCPVSCTFLDFFLKLSTSMLYTCWPVEQLVERSHSGRPAPRPSVCLFPLPFNSVPSVFFGAFFFNAEKLKERSPKFPRILDLELHSIKGGKQWARWPKLTDRTSALKLLGLRAAHSFRDILAMHSFSPLLLHPCVHNPTLHPTDKHALCLRKAFACFSFSPHFAR